MHKHTLLIVTLLLICWLFPATLGAQINLIPQPKDIKVQSTRFIKLGKTKLDISESNFPELPNEAYSISITKKGTVIKAKNEVGVIWAKRTLQQLKNEEGKYPEVEITDYPEFSIRGFMYDSGRNFIHVSLIKEYIELISQYKLNVFHWHLTDKPAWRIECKAYPELNNPKFQKIGRDEGMFYTYDEIREVIRFAKERGVMVIPEIDMPGHSDYFQTTFGCKMNSEKGMQILEKCLIEFFNEIPVQSAPYIHIGSDEVTIQNKEEFMNWAESLVRKYGRKTMVWDPGLKGDNETIYQVWRDGSEEDNEVNENKKIVDSFMGYLNYVDPILFTNKMFFHTPCYIGKGNEKNIGGILCLWNDVRVVDDRKIAPHNGMMGGVLPFAERFWNGGITILNKYKDALPPATDEATKKLIGFQDKMLYHKKHFLPEELSYWMPNRPVEWKLDLCKGNGEVIKSVVAYGNVIDIDAVCRMYQLKDVELCNATRTLYAEKDTVIKAKIGFDAAARSDRNSDGIALQGKWENFGSVVVNGESLMPPVWEQPGLYCFHFHTWAKPEEELPYTDEQFYWTRKPVKVKLNKGNNTISISTKKHFDGQRFQFAFLEYDMP